MKPFRVLISLLLAFVAVICFAPTAWGWEHPRCAKASDCKGSIEVGAS